MKNLIFSRHAASELRVRSSTYTSTSPGCRFALPCLTRKSLRFSPLLLRRPWLAFLTILRIAKKRTRGDAKPGNSQRAFWLVNSLHDKAFASVFKKLLVVGLSPSTHIWLESYFDDSFLHCLVFKEHPPTVASHKSASTYYSIPSVSSSTFSKIFHRPAGAEGDGGKAADFG